MGRIWLLFEQPNWAAAHGQREGSIAGWNEVPLQSLYAYVFSLSASFFWIFTSFSPRLFFNFLSNVKTLYPLIFA
jgi:hypothetical protein